MARCRWKRCVVGDGALKEILDINPVGRRARVPSRASVTWQSRPLHRIISTRTGPFLTNRLFHWRQRGREIRGGVHCLKYGLTVHNA
ncbi:hypothetical protein ACNKHT_19470 [Shigella flexneri]